jgi:hypothetical protein
MDMHHDIPKFDPSKTALFTSIYNIDGDEQKRMEYRDKIREDCFRLLENGYDSLIVSYGNFYGMMALKTLLKIKESNPRFKLFCGKVLGERSHLSDDGLNELKLVLSCNNWFGIHKANVFIQKVISCVSVISCEDTMILSNQKTPQTLLEYYGDL